MGLDPLDRQMLVKLMAGFNEKDDPKRTFIPHSSASRRLSLSSLGALLDAAGDWVQLPAGVSLEQWRHLASLGAITTCASCTAVRSAIRAIPRRSSR